MSPRVRQIEQASSGAIEQASKFIDRSVCHMTEGSNRRRNFSPDQSLANWKDRTAWKCSDRSDYLKSERSNRRRNSSPGLSVANRKDRKDDKIHRQVCLSQVRRIEQASKFIDGSLCLSVAN